MKSFLLTAPVLSALLAVTLLNGFALHAASPSATAVFYHENVLGTSLELQVAGASEAQAARCEAAALAEVDRLAAILSSYDATSEVSRWQRTQGQAVAVSPELDEVLSLFDQWRARTGGALNPAAAAIGAVWREAEAKQQLPTADVLQPAVAAAARTHWRRQPGALRVTHLSETPLVFNSLTKSFILERAAAAAMAAGQPSGLMLNLGGDLLVRGAMEATVAIADPQADAENAIPLDVLRLSNRAVATSGSYRRGYEIHGRHYSHILDPRTGRPADAIASATVIAPQAVDAGALATAMCVLAPDESAALAGQLPDVDYLIVLRDGRRVQSAGWKALPRPPVQLAAANPAALPATGAVAERLAGPAWDDSMELVINLELARVQDGRYRRPYVAVWVEDKDKFPVRTVALWYQKPRWLPDLRAWYRSDQMRQVVDSTDLANTISSATRSAGKYSLKWDGKDDKGVPVKPGKYTILIEVVREHGTYQLIRREMEFNGVPAQVPLPANAEVASASLDYRRKAAR